MLTKEERAAIAEKLRSTYYITNSTLFKALTGEEELIENDQVKELCVIGRVIFDLCDTSNMIELPIDKDGEVIKVGDTVYVDDDVKYKVAGYMMCGNSKDVILAAGAEPVYTKEPANNITHKKPVANELLIEQIRRVIDKGHMSAWSMAELFNIVDQLESLSDKDE